MKETKNKSLPNFLIVGTMKSGTTSLAHTLTMHPDVFVAKKELHFFNTALYAEGIEKYAELFQEVQHETLIGEKTPSYYQLETVRDRIFEHFPNMKLVWIFRNPVARAYSHYHFFIWRGQEYRSFRKVISTQLKKRPKKFIMRYIERGEYVTFVKMYLEKFPIENFKFIKYEDYKNEPELVINDLLQFLKPGAKKIPLEKSKRVNVTRVPHFPIVTYLATALYRRLRKGYRVLEMIKNLNHKKNQSYPEIDQDIKQVLQEHYRPYNEELAHLTKLDLADWTE